VIVSLEPELLERLSRLDGGANARVVEELDADLARAVRRTAVMRRLFYAAVLSVALYGTATGAVAQLGLPWPVAVGGIFALELGGVVFLSNAETRRRLGEHATLSRMLGAVVAGAAATFNLLTHRNVLFGGFFALMSVLGFLAWWLDVENKRRDRLRARGQLAAATPGYELWAHWVCHPRVTRRARGFAKAYPQLGLYGSLEAALITLRRQKRNAALADALRRRIRHAVGTDLADIAVLTFDMDEVAHRLRAGADYDGLTALLGSELTAERVLHGRDDPAAVAARAWLAEHRPAAAIPAAAYEHLHADGNSDGEPESHPPGQVAPPPPPPATPADHHGSATPTVEPLPELPRPHPPRQRVNGDTAAPPAGTTTLATLRRPGRGVTVAVPANRTEVAPTADEPLHADAGTGPAPQATGRPDAAPPSAPPAGRAPVRVRVLGTPAVLGADGGAVRGLRAKSMELLVYLVVHRGGAPLADIAAAVWPDAPAPRAAQRLSTCTGNLRTVLRRVDPADESAARLEPIVNTGGHYHLDPAVVDVDWWRLLDEHRQALDDGERTGVREVVTAAAARLAEGCDYLWLRTDPDALIDAGTPSTGAARGDDAEPYPPNEQEASQP